MYLIDIFLYLQKSLYIVYLFYWSYLFFDLIYLFSHSLFSLAIILLPLFCHYSQGLHSPIISCNTSLSHYVSSVFQFVCQLLLSRFIVWSSTWFILIISTTVLLWVIIGIRLIVIIAIRISRYEAKPWSFFVHELNSQGM